MMSARPHPRVAPDHLFPGIAQDLGGGAVGLDDVSLGVGNDDPFDGTLEYADGEAQAFLAFQKRRFALFERA